MKVAILPYKVASVSSKRLAKGLEIKGIRTFESKYEDREGRLVINWGHSKTPGWYKGEGKIINSFSAVEKAKNKLTSLNILRDFGVSVPFFTTDRGEAESYLQVDRNRMVGRTLLEGSRGAGCYLLSSRDEDIEVASGLHDHEYKLFTQYIPKSAEFRVHVHGGEVFDITQKKKKSSLSLTTFQYKIRSYENGWVFCRNGIEIPPKLEEESIAAVTALGLDFGAVDIVWNRNMGVFVLEVNTAPALTGQTLENYIQQFQPLVDEVMEVGGNA